jgi:hypothetical protein
MRIRIRHLVLALAAILAVAGAAAVIASAAYYKSSRPALKIDFLTKHHQITRIGFRILVRCERRSDGAPSGSAIIASGTDRPIPFNRVTGRFRARLFVQGGESDFLTLIRGTVQRDKVTGRILEDADIQAPPRRCRSGTEANHWVRFVAHRGTGPRPFD